MRLPLTAPGAATPLLSNDRREFPRSTQIYPVCIRADTPAEGAIVTHGRLVNVSLGGALVSVQDFLSRQQPCSIEIYGAAGRVIPNLVAGRIVGTSIGRSGEYLLRIEFSEPLQSVEEPGQM